MKFIKLDLLTLLISLFLFASCENTATIGLEVDPSIAIKGTLIDTVTISSRTVAEDVPTTVGAARYPLGYLKDVVFGSTESSISLSVNLPYDAYDFGTTPVLDSAILVLNYGGEFYGDSTATYSIQVNELAVNLSRETTFPATKNYPTFTPILGTKTGRLYPTTPFKVTDIVAGKADTMRTATPQLRIKLDPAFVQNKIINAGATALKTNGSFGRHLGGFKISINKSASTGNGGLAFFEFTDAKSELALYYKKTNSTTTSATDTVNVSFPVASIVAATIAHDYTGTPVATQLSNPTTQYPVTYLQPLGGVRNKISFPYLAKFTENVGKVVVNKAELVIDVSAGSDPIPYGPSPRLSLYRYDIAERRQNVPDNDNYSQDSSGDPRALGEVFGGYYNAITRQYVFVVTSYIQDLLDKKTIDYGTFLAPIPKTEFETYPSIATGARSVIGSFKKNPAAGDNVMKLNIYYTKIN
ncbi:MAG: DUF4270 family protein [Pedobacter sp.]|nr:DUF4270 family protein [Pedobacter sp.]